MTRDEQTALERLTKLALEGKAASPDVTRERAREVVETRVRGCQHVTGQTPAALAVNEPERFRSWLRGNARALVREGLIASGELSSKSLAWLQRREEARRERRDFDEVNDEFDDMFDSGEQTEPEERYP